ncbi:hypothetical protein BGX31_004172, partial [Mortierella sp. GBA43]
QASDSKGDQIHQPLMAKKMQRLEASADFRPFKFRIQAFTNAFHDDLMANGLTEDILPLRKVKVYLWKHRFISRFNEDGKKQKSKGNHVWNIEARKIQPSAAQGSTSNGNNNNTNGNGNSSNSNNNNNESTSTYDEDGNEIKRPSSPSAQWEFREYSSRIAGQIIKFARVGVPYVYAPRVWDAQMSCPVAKFTSPWLPSWLKWHKGELKGIPGPDAESCTITVRAQYVREGEDCELEMTFHLTVSDPAKEGELMDSHNEHEEDDELEEEEYDEKGQPQPQQSSPSQQQGSSSKQQQHQSQSQSLSQTQQQQQQTQQQTQQQLQHLHLQEKQRKSDDEMSDGGHDGDDDVEMEDDSGSSESKAHLRKQARERRSFHQSQDAKRRKHDRGDVQ